MKPPDNSMQRTDHRVLALLFALLNFSLTAQQADMR
jgi:hypothetical protein